MQRIIHHVHKIKAQPHHVRKQVAFGLAGATTGLIALVWLTASLATGAFAIKASNFAESAGQAGGVETVRQDGSQVAGAAAALPADDPTPRIQVVDQATTTPAAPAQPTDRTVIPF